MLKTMMNKNGSKGLQGLDGIGYDGRKRGGRWGSLIQTEASRWFPFVPQYDSSLPRLFCFPYGGGNAVIFKHWQSWLQHCALVYPVQLPGRGMRYQEPSYQQIEPLIVELANLFQPYLDRPYYLFGHSMGALIVYELACYLQKNFQSPPKHVIVSGFRAPHLPNPKPPIHTLTTQQFIGELAKMNGIPQEILENPEYLKLFLPSLRADFQLCETYIYQEKEPLQASITAFGGDQDAEVSEEMLWGWKYHTTCQFQLVRFSGNHFFIHQEEKAVVKQIETIVNGE